jgi:predicted O-methyltransferase YrrM
MKTLIDYILNKQSFKHFIKNPSDFRFIIHYLKRESKLVKLTGEEKVKIKRLLNEAENIRKYIIDKLSKIPAFHGAMVSPLEGPIIYTIIRCLKPRIVIETGVANGASSTFILSALEKNNLGKLYSIDLPSKDLLLKEEIGWLVPQSLRHRWELIIGDSRIVLPKLLAEIGHVDIFLHDSLHTLEHVLFELKESYNYIPKGGFLIIDDINVEWIKKINQEIKTEKLELFYDLLVLKK